MSEVLKAAKLMQYNIEFCGMGLLPILLDTDAEVARAFYYKRGVGRMKHLDVRALLAAGKTGERKLEGEAG